MKDPTPVDLRALNREAFNDLITRFDVIIDAINAKRDEDALTLLNAMVALERVRQCMRVTLNEVHRLEVILGIAEQPPGPQRN